MAQNLFVFYEMPKNLKKKIRSCSFSFSLFLFFFMSFFFKSHSVLNSIFYVFIYKKNKINNLNTKNILSKIYYFSLCALVYNQSMNKLNLTFLCINYLTSIQLYKTYFSLILCRLLFSIFYSIIVNPNI